jgi:hypothetical protein
MLRRVDREIRQLWRVMRRVPEHQYDLYVLADHGQVACKPYRELTGGRSFERSVLDELPDRSVLLPPEGSRSGLVRGIRDRRKEAPDLFQHYLNYTDEDFVRCDDPEAHQQDDVRVISAGPNAFVYVLGRTAPLDIEALDDRFPGLAEKLSQSTGVGFVLARSVSGPVCVWRGERHPLGDSAAGPFAGRADAAVVIRGMIDLMAMPSAGDLVIYGTDSAEGNVSFIPELGCHAGASHDELHTFILRPADVVLPSPIHHPVQLYDHFIGYRMPDHATEEG